jgi:alkylhydroperoxidase family enzyme
VQATGDRAVVAAALADWRTAPISPRVRAALRFLEKLTLTPQDVGSADASEARVSGLSDRALREAIYVCFLLSTMDRLADALGFPLLDPGQLRKGAKSMARFGYRRLSV